MPPPPLPDKPWETVVRCRCGWAGSFCHLVKQYKGAPRLPATSGEPSVSEGALSSSFVLPLPADSRIVHAGGVEETWSLPRSGKSRGLFFFGGFWLVVSVPMAVLLWLRPMDNHSLTMDIVFRGVFGILFPIIGALVLYFGLRMKYARHWLSLDAEYFTLEREFFGRRKKRSLRRASITRVELREFYSQGYQPVYGLEIRGADGKLRFGTGLADDEKAWLEQDLRRALQASPEGAAATADRFSRPAPAHTGALEIEQSGRAVTLRLTPKKSDLAGAGLLMMIFCVAFWTIVYFNFFRNDSWDDGPFAFAGLLFKIPFVVLPLLFFVLGWMAWREGGRLAKTVIVLHANDSALILEKIHRRQSRQQQWSRTEVERVQTGSAGTKNQSRIMHGEIVAGDRVAWFGMGHEPEDLEVMCAAMRKTLGLTTPPTHDSSHS